VLCLDRLRHGKRHKLREGSRSFLFFRESMFLI
jgi:hypothetical protein